MTSRIPAKVHSSDPDVNQLQAEIAKVLRIPLSQPQAYGVLMPKVALASGPNVIQHGLGRPLIGWQVVRQRASAAIYDTQDANATPAATLQLTATFAVTVDLFVF